MKHKQIKNTGYAASVPALILCILVLLFISSPVQSQIDMDELASEDNFQWGIRAFHNGNLNQSVFYFEKSLGYKPQNFRSRVWLGKALYKSGFDDAALNDWESLRSGKTASSLLENTIRIVSMRNGTARDTGEPGQLVISHVIDASKEMYRRFKRPTAIHARKDGSLYIVAFGSNEIVLVNANGTVIDVLKGGIAGFDHPYDLAESGDGFLYVSEYEGNRIAKCSLNGNKVKTFGKKGIGDGELLGPQSLCLDTKGYLYVTDYGNRRVVKFDTDGNFILSFGGGRDKPVLSGPSGIGFHDNRVFVTDPVKKSLFVFDESGNLISSSGSDFLIGPEGFVFFGPDTLLVADSSLFAQDTRIVTFDLVSEKWSVHALLENEAERLVDIAVDTSGDLFAADYNKNKIFALSPTSALSSGFFIQIERIDADKFPAVIVDVAVQDRFGKPVPGLNKSNFIITESFIPVKNVSMFTPVAESKAYEVVFLFEKSKAMEQYREELESAVKEMFAAIGSSKKAIVVSAGKDPVMETDVNASRLSKLNMLKSGSFRDEWRCDAGLRMAGTKLLSYRTKRAVVFFTEGNLSGNPFPSSSILDLARYLKNNYIACYVVQVGKEGLSDDLVYLSEETGGGIYSPYAAQGLAPIAKEIANQGDPRYVFSYKSAEDTKFGRRFIPCEVEVNLRKRSGRDEGGYFGPIE